MVYYNDAFSNYVLEKDLATYSAEKCVIKTVVSFRRSNTAGS